MKTAKELEALSRHEGPATEAQVLERYLRQIEDVLVAAARDRRSCIILHLVDGPYQRWADIVQALRSSNLHVEVDVDEDRAELHVVWDLETHKKQASTIFEEARHARLKPYGIA